MVEDAVRRGKKKKKLFLYKQFKDLSHDALLMSVHNATVCSYLKSTYLLRNTNCL